MANTPKKVVVIGLDGVTPSLIEKHIAAGHLPTIKKLMQEGAWADNCLPPYPTVTPPNWAAIATGAWGGTHSLTGFHYQDPGAPLTNTLIRQAFSSENVKAEFIWDVLDKAGKKCIVLNYPGSWPSHMKNGIMVGGSGLTVGEDKNGILMMNTSISVCADQMVTTGIYPGAIRGKFAPAHGWTGIQENALEPLEMEFSLNFPNTKDNPAPTTWYLLALQSGGNGYDQIALSSSRNLKQAFCSLKLSEWTSKIITNIKMADGYSKEVSFNAKLIELSEDAEDMRLLITALIATSGWSNPAEVAGQIDSRFGLIGIGGGLRGFDVGWYDLDTWIEITERYTQWLEDAAKSLLTKNKWDVFFMHSHPPDWSYHIILTAMDPALNSNETSRKEAWEMHLRMLQAQDRMIAQILKVVEKDTLIVLVSDHGAVADGTPFNPFEALATAGLVVFDEEEASERERARPERHAGSRAQHRIFRQMPDLSKSKALPMRSCYVYVNLKGRDEGGIVDPGDYEKVQQQVIDTLLTYVDPTTGKRPISLALSKNDARILGLSGDTVGDVVYALYPWFGGQHDHILPAAEWGVGSIKALLCFSGPGIKNGLRLERTCWLPDLVPTLCYLLGWPVPSKAEGAVLYQAFTDPDFMYRRTQANTEAKVVKRPAKPSAKKPVSRPGK